MKLFIIFSFIFLLSMPVLASDEAIKLSESFTQSDEAPEERGLIMLPKVGEDVLMLRHNIGSCTSDIEGAIHYNSTTKSPETCTSDGWRAWGK